MKFTKIIENKELWGWALWNHLWTRSVVIGQRTWGTGANPSAEHLQETGISWVAASPLHSPRASRHADVFHFPSSKQLCGQKESMTQFLSDHSSAHRAENDCFAVSRTLAWHDGFRGELAFRASLYRPDASHVPVPWISACPFSLSVILWLGEPVVPGSPSPSSSLGSTQSP